MPNTPVIQEERVFCKLCERGTLHMDLSEQVPPSVRWKCMECGEYNRNTPNGEER